MNNFWDDTYSHHLIKLVGDAYNPFHVHEYYKRPITMDNKFEWTESKVKEFLQWNTKQFTHEEDWRQELIDRFKKQQSEVKEHGKEDREIRIEKYRGLEKYITAFRNKTTKGVIVGIHGGFGGFNQSGETHFVDQDMPVFLEDENYEIYRIKNDSGLEFSIGDKYKDGTITHFTLSDKEINAHGRISNNYTFACEINSLTKPNKEPIVVIDGEQVYVGDTLWWVDSAYDIHSEIVTKRWYYGAPQYFTSKESAEQYIRDNKHSISYRDLDLYLTEYTSKFNRATQTNDIHLLYDFIQHFKPNPDTI